MSTFLEQKAESRPIRSVEDLRSYFSRYAKSDTERLLGVECELFGVDRQTGRALPYSGPKGVEAVLNALAHEFGYEPIVEGGHTIALHRKGTLISLEPGGQVELSADPVRSVHEVREQLNDFFFELKTIVHFVPDIAWITVGIHPFSNTSDIEWVPKKRYEIMARYLGARGKRAHDMMKRTCGDQVNLDYTSEEDAIFKMRLALSVTPVAAAIFANSSISRGRPNGFASERLNIWRDTDPDRTGLILNLICESCSFQDYLNYVLDVPMMFLVRQKKWLVTRGLTFRKFVEKGFQGIRPTEEDFELHLSTIFTEARFKQYVELRGMDGQRNHLIPAVSAFWKGLFYDHEAGVRALKLMRRFKEREILKLHLDVERRGLKAKMAGHSVLDLARELVRISEQGLRNQKAANARGEDERIYLAPLKEEVLGPGESPGERMVKLWTGSFKRNPHALIEYLGI